MNDRENIDSRIGWLLEEIRPINQHPDLGVAPLAYNNEQDILYLDVMPRSAPRWAETAYQFARQGGMKYDRNSTIYGIDGQPRVSYSGMVWARYIGDFLDGSRVAFHVWSEQPSHEEAEEQLMQLYAKFWEMDHLEPVGVFRKYWK